MRIGKCSGKTDQGFTLIELLVVIGILAILGAVAIPAFSNWIPNYRLKSAARDVVSNFQRTKLEAVRRNANVIISFNPHAYDPKGAVGSYQIFVDDGSGGGTANNFVMDGTETVIVQATMPDNVSLYSAVFTGGNTAAGFNSRGLPASSRIGSVKLRNNRSRYYKITLSLAGNIALKKSNDGVTWN
ncbi:MAG: GspH/FimT family pseudopilin [Deltaproteobacteria bacterium]|nr:GspH/FimT family pseudopilin [Deltaproteobacteria bacterium]